MNEPSTLELDRALDVRAPQLHMLSQYYAGEQPLAFLSPDARRAIGKRFDRIAVNLPRLSVTAIAERLRVTGFLNPDGTRNRALWEAWLRCDLDQTAPAAHREALATGESAVIVWARPEWESHRQRRIRRPGRRIPGRWHPRDVGSGETVG